MSNRTLIHGGAAETNTMRVYYNGSDTLGEGYALCFNFDAIDVTDENISQTSPDVGQEYWNDARRLMVEKPAEGNKLHFAGAVSQRSANFTGPGWIEIHRPGSICNIYAYASADHGSTGITTNTGQILTFCPGEYFFYDGGFPGTGSAMVLQDVDRSSTKGVVMAELQTGLPSGGFYVLDVLSTATAGILSVSISAPLVGAGVYALMGGLDATASIAIGTTKDPGNYLGQRFKVVLLSIQGTNTYSLALSAVKVAMISAGAGGCAVGLNGQGEISLVAESVGVVWDGVQWVVETLNVISVTFA